MADSAPAAEDEDRSDDDALVSFDNRQMLHNCVRRQFNLDLPATLFDPCLKAGSRRNAHQACWWSLPDTGCVS